MKLTPLLALIVSLAVCRAGDYMSAEDAQRASQESAFEHIMQEVSRAARKGEKKLLLYSMKLWYMPLMPYVEPWNYDDGALKRIKDLGYKVHKDEKFCTQVHYVTWQGDDVPF